MDFTEKAKIMDHEAIGSSITRMAHEILEKNKNTKTLCLIGIRNRGVFIARRLADSIENINGQKVPVGVLDITMYRDDISNGSAQPVMHKTQIDFNISKKNIVLVDDVLYTGRTIRAALDALIDFGRPKSTQLAVLVDRGHRELPIRADFAGKNMPTAENESVEVRLKETDKIDEVVLMEQKK